MPTANEKKALWFLAFVAISGSAVRLWRARLPAVPAADSVALVRQIDRVDSARDARHKRVAMRRDTTVARAVVRPEPLDLDRASASEIEALPGIGAALAKRIIDNRDSLGAFGDIDALCDVRGVGVVLAEKLRPLVTFTGPRRPLSAGCGEASTRPKKARAARGSKPR